MGSCSSVSKSGNATGTDAGGYYNDIPIPRRNNPAGIPSNAITQDEYLALYGLRSPVSSYGVDKIGGANMTRMSQKQRDKTYSEMNLLRREKYEIKLKSKKL